MEDFSDGESCSGKQPDEKQPGECKNETRVAEVDSRENKITGQREKCEEDGFELRFQKQDRIPWWAGLRPGASVQAATCGYGDIYEWKRP